MQILAQVVSIAIALAGIALFVRAIRQILGVVKMGQPAHRTDKLGSRAVTMLKETLGHTRMLQWRWVGVGHWFVFVGFGLLFFTLVTAFGQLFDAHFALPVIGHFFLWEWVSELFTFVMIVAIIAFIYYRATRPMERTRGPKGRFWGSTMWQGYFVEMVILGVGLCIVVLRGLEYALLTKGGEHADNASALHFPLSFPIGKAFEGLSGTTIENLIYLVAMLKIVISFTWMITISLQPTMGVAWHRFLAFFNIFFRRNPEGRTALGGLAPMTQNGEPIDFEDLEEMDEDTVLGVGQVEDFSWKGLLDFSTCTECGRCQSQCPAWNTEKPLSPKLLITALRDHAYAKAPYVQAAQSTTEGEREALLEGNASLRLEAERPLVGDTGDDWFYNPESGAAVIDSEVLWNCTSCGACVQQCPVDIEHVDHIIDMRRYAVLVESNFPTELNGLFKGLENKGNPWNMSPKARMDWAKDLPFDVKVVGEDVESLDEVEWLFWVGCAGAYEDRAKKTTRAVAELLDMAGVSFAVLGNGETCTGDPARRAGNEFVFQGLATQNAETFKETKVKKVVSTCAHCFNTLKNEYAAFGVELEVVHHTQLLNRLVREKKLAPVAAADGGSKRSITYHDPCYIGRHNGVYAPPRELLSVIPDATLTEMPRNSERSFCCGAGGARMWMEENTGERINVNRTKEAVATGADQIAVGCPFCRVMLSDGLTAQQAAGEAREEVEVLDIAQMLLASVKGEGKPAARKADAAPAANKAAGAAVAEAAAEDEETKAEPDAGDTTQTDETVTDTEDVGPAAKASGGSSLFDMGEESTDDGSADDKAEEAPAPEAKPAAGTESSGGSLFDLGGDEEPETKPAAKADQAEEPAASAESAPAASGASATPATEVPEGGSLFDLEAPAEEPAPAASDEATPADQDAAADSTTDGDTDRSKDAADTDDAPSKADTESEAQAAPATTSTGTTATPASKVPEGGSLFDIEAPAEEPAPAASDEATPADHDAAADSTTDADTDRSKDAADTDVAPEDGAEDDATESADVADAAAQGPTPDSDGSESSDAPLTSLRDIKAKYAEGAATSTDSETAAPDADEGTETPDTPEATEAPEAPEADAVPEPHDEPSDAVTDQTSAGESDAEDEPAEEDTAEESGASGQKKSKPATSGDSHSPRTDAEIGEGGSLFDL
ncbi:MAG: Fe-S cluster protein [Marmoricola sp.]|nr:Fe-S cluster protein [Marmoricola sp.]